jgi:hypothetical protein
MKESLKGLSTMHNEPSAPPAIVNYRQSEGGERERVGKTGTVDEFDSVCRHRRLRPGFV